MATDGKAILNRSNHKVCWGLGIACRPILSLETESVPKPEASRLYSAARKVEEERVALVHHSLIQKKLPNEIQKEPA